MERLHDPRRTALAAGSVIAQSGSAEETAMHPTIHYQIAMNRAADMQRRAERDRVARAAHAARQATREPGSARHLAAPRAFALRLLRLS
jgi:hypothetical protein